MNRNTIAAVFAALSLPLASMAAGPVPVSKTPVKTATAIKPQPQVQTGPKAPVKAPAKATARSTMKKAQPRKTSKSVKRPASPKLVKTSARK